MSRAATISIAVLAVLLSVATIQRNAEYLSGLTLWQSVLDRWPPHARAHRNLAAELKLAGRPDEEIVHLRAAVQDLPEIRNVLGLELLALGRNAKPPTSCSATSRDHPRDADALGQPRHRAVRAGTQRRSDCRHSSARSRRSETTDSRSATSRCISSSRTTSTDAVVARARSGAADAERSGRAQPAWPRAHRPAEDRRSHREFRASLALQPDNNDAAGYLERTLKASAAARRT